MTVLGIKIMIEINIINYYDISLKKGNFVVDVHIAMTNKRVILSYLPIT